MKGIYKIKNKVNGKIYIGLSKNIEGRWETHKDKLNRNVHPNSHLRGAWNKYGEQNFDFSVIEELVESMLDEREIYWIDFYKTLNTKFGYNKREGGGSGGKLSEETKRKLSKVSTGRKHTKETRIKMSKTHTGKKRSKETCESISKALKNSSKNKGENNWQRKRSGELHPSYGYKHTDEAREKIAEASRNRVFTKERNNKISEQNRKYSDEFIIEIIKSWNDGNTANFIINKFGISRSFAHAIKNNTAYKHIDRNNLGVLE